MAESTLLLHHRVVFFDVLEDGRRDVAVRQIGFAAGDDIRVVEQTGQARVMSLVDDTGEVWALLGVVAVELANRRGHAIDQSVVHMVVNQHVVRGNAGLAGVEELSEHNPLGGHVQVGALIDDARTLAPELQSDRREMPGGRRHDDAADGAVAGVEDVIPLLL
jgi:hypothetical protein